MKDNKNNQLKIIISTLINELKIVSNEYTVYSKKLPLQTGFSFCAKNFNKKDLALAFYQYASHLATSVSKMESALSGLSQIILYADKNDLRDSVMFCDEILTQYGEFKKSVSLFTSQNELLLSKDDTTPSEMIKILSEFGYKLKYFNSFLQKNL